MTKEYFDLDVKNITIKNFLNIFEKFGLPNCVVEIGCYYGKTTYQLVNIIAPTIPSLKYYAIDPYKNSLDIKENLEELHDIFIKNLNKFKFKDNIIFKRKTSFEGLVDLYSSKVSPQFIYIDGNHTSSVVLSDLVLSFEILQKGGVIFCDDSVTWKFVDENNKSDPQMSPRMAVDSFIMCNWSKLEVIDLPFCGQTAFLKL